MKNNYFIPLLITVLTFPFLRAFSQQPLTEAIYGNTVINYLNEVKDNFGLSETDINDLYLNSEVFSKSTNITHYYVNQRYEGIKVYNAISNVAIKNNQIFHYSNGFYQRLASTVNINTPAISQEQAVINVANHFQLGVVEELNIVSTSEKKVVFSTASISKVNIPVELVIMPVSESDLRLSWDLSIHTIDGSHWWSVRVDAISGEIIDVNDWILTCNFGDSNPVSLEKEEHAFLPDVQPFTLFKSQSFFSDGAVYNVFPFPVESPNHGTRQLLFEPGNSNASPLGWHDTNGIDGPEYTITRGNNVWAQEDRDGNDDEGYAPEGTALLDFNFPLDLEQQPAGYEDSSITNLFYANNMMHDVWYEYGFDESAGNFQQNNYGNGGVGGDFVFADGQDGLGLNNATFGTPPDGGNPGMTMFLWSASGPIGNPLTINNGILAGDYSGLEAGFGGFLTAIPITADLVLTQDFELSNSDIRDACGLIQNSSEIDGKIVVIRRGTCEFGSKILKVENEGAVAVIMVNNEAGDPILMGAGAEGDQVTIPSIMISQTDGEALISELENGSIISASLVAAGPFQKDGSLDNGIMAHEYGHGISNRLTAGPSQAGCLTNAEQMGEGWSDWFSLMMTMKSTDLDSDARGIGTYVIGQSTSGGGIRPAPYTTDFSINGATYGDTNNPGLSVPHGIGFVWATMLWDLTWAYIDKYGFDSNVLSGNGGNNKVMQLVIDGMKLQPCNPGFVDGRDAILAADIALTGGEDQCLIWEVFSKRGLGYNADQGSRNSRSDQVEDFSMPDPNDPSLINCNTLSIDNFNKGDYKIYPNPTNDYLRIKVNKDFGKVILSLVDINGREVYKETNVQLSDEKLINLSSLNSGIYILKIKGDYASLNEKIVIH